MLSERGEIHWVEEGRDTGHGVDGIISRFIFPFFFINSDILSHI